jgi:hypothetical protein
MMSNATSRRRVSKVPLPSTTHTQMAALQTSSFAGVRVAAPKTRVASARVAVAPVASLQKVRAGATHAAPGTTCKQAGKGCGGGVARSSVWIDPGHSGNLGKKPPRRWDRARTGVSRLAAAPLPGRG